MNTISRRSFLTSSFKSAAALGLLGSFGRMNASAAGSGSYQALVCIFLSGGNDGHNTIVPLSTAQQGFSAYQNARGPLTLSQSSLLHIANGSDTYGLHPSLPEIQQLYTGGHAAVLANVGNLVQPLTLSQYKSNNSAIIPAALFSHSDQTGQWQSADPTGLTTTGWGGRMVDQMGLPAAAFPVVTDTGGCGLFCTGVQNLPTTVPPGYGSSAPTGIATLDTAVGNAATKGLQQLLHFSNGLSLVQADNGIMSRGNQYANTLTKLLPSNLIKTPFPANNELASQLLTVANMMAVRNQLGLTRQIFFCQLGPFDTHGGQITEQQGLLQQVSQAVGAFYQATQELGIEQNVVTFTSSEFGRTLSPSGDGSDHGWSNHHFIIGGGVRGGRFYGKFPLLQIGSPQDVTGRGVFIPTTSLAQYGATLAQWFGVASGNMTSVFPNIGNFPTSNLGFLG